MRQNKSYEVVIREMSFRVMVMKLEPLWGMVAQFRKLRNCRRVFEGPSVGMLKFLSTNEVVGIERKTLRQILYLLRKEEDDFNKDLNRIANKVWGHP